MKAHDVVARALKDEKYAQALKEKALAADRGGAGSEAWKVLLGEFADNPRELARMAPARSSLRARTTWTTATTTTLTTTFTATGGPTIVTVTTVTLTTTVTTATITREPEPPDEPEPGDDPDDGGEPDAPRG